MVEENKEVNQVDKIFNEMAELQPRREVSDEEIGFDGDGDGQGTIEDRMKLGRKPSDFQILDMRLNPDLSNKGQTPYLNMITMSRIFPDVYNNLLNIIVKDIIRTTDLTVTQAIASANTALSEAIDGEARIDAIYAFKGVGETKTEEEKKKLGLP